MYPMEIVLKDNASAEFKDNPDLTLLLPLENISNRTVKDLLCERNNRILVFPNSFSESKDLNSSDYPLIMRRSLYEGKLSRIVIETGNIAGFIGLGNLSLSIHSRFTQDDGKGHYSDYFLHYMLEKVFSLNLVNLSHSKTDDSVFDFMLFLFPRMLNEALAQGLFKEYRHKKYNDANIKGAIDINRHIRYNMPFKGTVAYNTREFSYDNHVTELIRHAIEYISTHQIGKRLFQNDPETHENVSRIISATPQYQKRDIQKIIIANKKIICHPYFTQYAPLQKLCLRILQHEKLKYGDGIEEIHGILFDVSWLWEEYLATLLVPQGFKHPDNRNDIGAIYLTRDKKALRRFPDFYYMKDKTVIIDAKYKKNIDTRNDINQMVTYMYRLRGHIGIFVKPLSGDSSKSRSYKLDGYGTDNDAEIVVLEMPIPKNAQSYDEFKIQMQEQEKIIGKIHDMINIGA